MFRTLGALSGIVCPAFREGTCENQRVNCPYSHDMSLLQTKPPPEKRRKVDDTANAAQIHPPTSANRPAVQAARRPGAPAPVAQETQLKCPTLTSKVHPASSRISLGARQNGLKKIYSTLVAFYQPLLTHTDMALRDMGIEMAATDALAIEADVFRLASEHSYRNSSMSAAVGVTKRNKDELTRAVDEAYAALKEQGRDQAQLILQRCTETGSNNEVTAKRQGVEKRKLGRLTRERIVKAGFLCPKGDLQVLGYLTEIPSDWGPGGDAVDGTGEKQTCARCGTVFRVAPLRKSPDDDGQDPEACRFHPGRPRREQTSDTKLRKILRWTCCGRTVDAQTLGDDRCATGPHVFKEEKDEALHRRAPYTTFAQLAKDVGVEDSALEIAALDCEMSYTTAGLSVTRITLVDETGEVVFDELIRCSDDVQVLDYNTQFSGIQPKEYEENAVLDLHAARRALVQYVGPNTILVRAQLTQIGHGLENDLRAIRVVHTNVVDTCQLFPHPRGLPFRLALRDLVATHLGKIIQAGGSAVGHSSAEDAQTTLELVRYKWTQLCT